MQITVKDDFIGAKAINHRVEKGILAGLYAAGENIKDVALPMTPKKTEALRKSAKVSMSGSGAGTTSLSVSFNTDYAYNQEFTLYENYTTPGTGPFYLYKSFTANQFETVMIIARAIAGGLKGVKI